MVCPLPPQLQRIHQPARRNLHLSRSPCAGIRSHCPKLHLQSTATLVRLLVGLAAVCTGCYSTYCLFPPTVPAKDPTPARQSHGTPSPRKRRTARSEEHTSELQSLMRI